MSAVGELVQGERRGRWLVVAVVCAGGAGVDGRAGARGRLHDPRLAADHLRQRRRAAAGRLHGQRHRRVLPRHAGAGQRRGQRRGRRTDAARRSRSTASAATPARPGRRIGPARASPATAAPGNPYTLTINLRGRPACSTVQEMLTYVNGTTDVGVQFTLDGVRQRRRRAASTRRRTSTSRATTPASASSTPDRRCQVGGSQRSRRAARHASSRARRRGPLPGVVLRQRLLRDRRQHRRSAPNLSDTVNPALGDNDVGVQWNFANLAPGSAAQTFSTTWRFNHFSALDLAAAADQVDRQDRDGDRHGAQQRRQP